MGQYELGAVATGVTASSMGQYVLLESSLLDGDNGMWNDSECQSPSCPGVKLEGMGVVKDGASLTGHFRCPKCNTHFVRSTTFRIRQGKSTVSEANALFGIAPVVCGSSPTAWGRGMDFLGVNRPSPATDSNTQKRHLGVIETIGREDACDEMFNLALEDALADPKKRTTSDGFTIIDVMMVPHARVCPRTNANVVGACVLRIFTHTHHAYCHANFQL